LPHDAPNLKLIKVGVSENARVVTEKMERAIFDPANLIGSKISF
jgi:hypothetical protein